jgi:hypothetical protein
VDERESSRDRRAIALAAIAIVALPLSYGWLLSPGEDPPWLAPVIAVAEWGGLACASAAIWLSRRTQSPLAARARRIAIAAIGIYVLIWVALAALYRG